MGLSALTLGAAMGGLSAATSLLGSAQQASQQRMQAKTLEAQSAEYRRQSDLATQKGNIEAANIERRKSLLRREFADKQAQNRTALAASNVDMTSGSALDVSLGNIDRFAMDLGENAFEKQMKLWEANESRKNLDWQASQAEAQASYFKRTAGNMGPGILSALASGASGFVGGYSMAGGSLLKSPATTNKYWDRALQQWSSVKPLH